MVQCCYAVLSLEKSALSYLLLDRRQRKRFLPGTLKTQEIVLRRTALPCQSSGNGPRMRPLYVLPCLQQSYPYVFLFLLCIHFHHYLLTSRMLTTPKQRRMQAQLHRLSFLQISLCHSHLFQPKQPSSFYSPMSLGFGYLGRVSLPLVEDSNSWWM